MSLKSSRINQRNTPKLVQQTQSTRCKNLEQYVTACSWEPTDEFPSGQCVPKPQDSSAYVNCSASAACDEPECEELNGARRSSQKLPFFPRVLAFLYPRRLDP